MAPWAGTPGGATSEAWGPGWQVHLYVAMAIAKGDTWVLGPDPQAFLDRGNVMGRHVASPELSSGPYSVLPDNRAAGPNPISGKLWVDVSCDVESLGTHMGATETAGVAAKAEAGTCRVTLIDPTGKYDPLNPDSPFNYRGRTRLIPGSPLAIWVEWQDPAGSEAEGVSLFTGYVDSWVENWTPYPGKRRATVTGSDYTARLAQMDRTEQAPQGYWESTLQRYTRILDFFEVPLEQRGRADHFGPAEYQPTTLAQSAWELLTRLADDEVGMVYVDTYGRVNFVGQQIWAKAEGEAINWGCSEDPSYHDAVIAATVGGYNYNFRNAIFGAVKGGTMQSSVNAGSVTEYGYKSYKRTDLGLRQDSDARWWTTVVLSYSASPTVKMSDFTINPKVVPSAWPAIGTMIREVLPLVSVYWKPPDRDTAYEVRGRVAGFEEAITRYRWEFKWVLAQSSLNQSNWTLGPHARDSLDKGNVLGLYASV